MTDYTLYYWSLPFRGQAVRALLAFAGRSWTEGGDEAISKLMGGAVSDMPVPFMGPPVLVDSATGAAISQMPAIIFYLAEAHGLMPEDAALRALTVKLVNDANDVLDEMTQDGGRQMWTRETWRAFVPRLRKWMSLFEETGRRHGLEAQTGMILGGMAPGAADVVTATLWSTMTERFPSLGAVLRDAAPRIAGLSERIYALPALKALAQTARQDFGDAWCGGEIEKSLREVLA